MPPKTTRKKKTPNPTSATIDDYTVAVNTNDASLPPLRTETSNNESYTITVDAINKILQATQQKSDMKQSGGFPCFDPDHSRVDTRKWCEDVDKRINRDGLENFDVIPKVKMALIGRAKTWYEKYGYQHYDWVDLRASLIHTFSSGSDIITNLRNVANSESEEYISYTDFIIEKVSHINRLPFDIPEEMIVRISIGCISDIGLRSSLTFVMPQTIQNLIDHLSSIRERPCKKHHSQHGHNFIKNDNAVHRNMRKEIDDEHKSAKRIKISNDKRCYGCGKAGHLRNQCPEGNVVKFETLKNGRPDTIKIIQPVPDNKKVNACGFCGNASHDESRCWAKQKAARKQVNICKITSCGTYDTPVVINGKLHHCLLDTGSDCSLMRSDVAARLSNKKRQLVLLTEEIDVMAEFEELSIEITFHIIDKIHMKNEIIIGRDVLKDTSLEIAANANGNTLRRSPPNKCSVAFIENVFPEISVKYRNMLNNLLDKYALNFITGFPKFKVTTGCLDIRLSKDTTNVYYRPYRMAECEQKVTADIIRELKEHAIVRDSNSPFASPVVLVKKKMDKIDYV